MSYSSEDDVQSAVTAEVSKDANPADIKGINYDEIDCSYEEVPETETRSTLDDIERAERLNGNDPEFAGNDVVPVEDL
jgi:hypothetical protein